MPNKLNQIFVNNKKAFEHGFFFFTSIYFKKQKVTKCITQYFTCANFISTMQKTLFLVHNVVLTHHHTKKVHMGSFIIYLWRNWDTTPAMILWKLQFEKQCCYIDLIPPNKHKYIKHSSGRTGAHKNNYTTYSYGYLLILCLQFLRGTKSSI